MSTAAFAPPADLAMEPQDLIAGLGRGLAVIESFDDEHPRMTVAEVAARTGIPRSAARRHLLSLCYFGYAQTDGKQYWLAPRILRLGQSYLGAARLPRLVQPFIQRISRATGETVNFSVLDGHEVVYLARSNSPRMISIGFHAGARVPAHLVTPGPVLLSAFSEDALARWLAEHDFHSHGTHAPLTSEQFRACVQGVPARGHWVTKQMLDPSLCGVAVSLPDRRGVCQGALSMTVQVSAWSDDQIERLLVPPLAQAAQELHQIL